MNLNKITTFKRKLFITGNFKPRDLRNLIWKCTQKPETQFEDGSYQCHPGANRSFQDIWNIARSYFPDCTMEDVAYQLARLCWKKYCICNYCSVINRAVFYPASIYDGQYPGNIMGKSSVAKELRKIQQANSAEWNQETKQKKKHTLHE